jgi:hypothetical protein
MSRHRRSLVLSLVRVAAPLSLAALAVVSLGCNGAQQKTPPPYDAGIPCDTILPIYTDCADAGVAAPVAVCTASPSDSDPTVARIPAGSYPVGCQVQFYFQDIAAGGSCDPAVNECTCLAGDAGEGDAAAVPGYWSNCADAGFPPVE